MSVTGLPASREAKNESNRTMSNFLMVSANIFRSVISFFVFCFFDENIPLGLVSQRETSRPYSKATGEFIMWVTAERLQREPLVKYIMSKVQIIST